MHFYSTTVDSSFSRQKMLKSATNQGKQKLISAHLPEIKHRANQTNGLFYLMYQGELLAGLVYELGSDGTLCISDSYVQKDMEKDIWRKKLAESCLKYARDNNYQLQVRCPDIKAVFDFLPEYRNYSL